MTTQTPAVSVPTLLEHLGHCLLVDNQICDHLLYTQHSLLELLVLLGHRFVLQGKH